MHPTAHLPLAFALAAACLLASCGGLEPEDRPPNNSADANRLDDAGGDATDAQHDPDPSDALDFCDEASRSRLTTQGLYPEEGTPCDCSRQRVDATLCPCEAPYTCTSLYWMCTNAPNTEWSLVYACNGPPEPSTDDVGIDAPDAL